MITTSQRFALAFFKAPSSHFVLIKAVTVVGRGSDCDFVIDDPSVSRRHAEFRIVETELHIADLGSRNGTFVTEMLIQTSRVKPGDVVRFGNTAFKVAELKTISDGSTGVPEKSSESHSGETLCLPAVPLSTAQDRVLKMLMGGLQDKEIANRLSLSHHTVHNHTRAIFLACGVHSRTQLIAFFNKRIGIDRSIPT